MSIRYAVVQRVRLTKDCENEYGADCLVLNYITNVRIIFGS